MDVESDQCRCGQQPRRQDTLPCNKAVLPLTYSEKRAASEMTQAYAVIPNKLAHGVFSLSIILGCLFGIAYINAEETQHAGINSDMGMLFRLHRFWQCHQKIGLPSPRAHVLNIQHTLVFLWSSGGRDSIRLHQNDAFMISYCPVAAFIRVCQHFSPTGFTC